MRLAHTVPNVAIEASGPSNSVPSLCAALARLGHEVKLHTVAPGPAAWPHPRVAHTAHVRSILTRPLWGSAPLRRALMAEAAGADVLHTHGLWLLPNLYPARAVRGTDCRLVTSPRGTLSSVALQFSRRLKQVMWGLAQRAALEASDCLHATSLAEKDEILAAGIRRPIAVIANGVEIPEERPAAARSAERRRLLFLGRVHPKKGLDLLLPVWRQLEAEFPEWQLVIVGPGEGSHPDELRELAKALGCRHLEFRPAAHGLEKSRLYWGADLFVLPTRNENFGMAVAEALAHGVPVVTTRGAPWSGLESRGAGWWVPIDGDAMGAALREAMSLAPGDLEKRGAAGRDWMRRDFSWDKVASDMEAVYRWLAGGGSPPASVSAP